MVWGVRFRDEGLRLLPMIVENQWIVSKSHIPRAVIVEGISTRVQNGSVTIQFPTLRSSSH